MQTAIRQATASSNGNPFWPPAAATISGEGVSPAAMSTESNKARAIFLEAIEKPTPEMRADFLDDACAGDVELRQRVERLLRSPRTARLVSRRGAKRRRHRRPSDHRGARNRHWPLQTPATDRRRRIRRRLHGRPNQAGQATSGAEDYQAEDGYSPGHRPIRGRASGIGNDGPT